MKFARPLPIVLCAAALAMPAAAESVFTDTFEVNGWARLTPSGSFNIIETDPTFTHAPYAKLNNGVYYVDLPAPLTTDFTLTLRALHQKYARTLVAGLTNANGTQGYGLRWGSHNPDQFGGNGSVVLAKFTDQAPVVAPPSYYGDLLGSLNNSGHLAAVEGGSLAFATFRLSWVAATNTLTLHVDGVLRGRAVDASYRSFSRIIIGGGSGTLFDDMTLTTGAADPLPAAR